MALFSKKPTLDEIIKSIGSLTDEERKTLRDKWDDMYKAEDEREIDKIEEDKADNKSEKDEKAEEVNEESEEIGKDVDEIEEDADKDGDEKAEEAEDDKFSAFKAELDELRKLHDALKARFDALEENEIKEEDEDREPFGISARSESKSDKGESELEKARNKYFNF